MSHFVFRSRKTLLSSVALTLMLIAGTTSYLLSGITHVHAAAQFGLPVQPHYNHFLSTNYDGDAAYDDNNPTSGLSQQLYDDRAYPNTAIAYTQSIGAYNAFKALSQRSSRQEQHAWELVGPITGNTPAPVTYTGAATTVSGRVTAIAISNNCTDKLCRVYIGAAGGGIWKTSNALSPTPQWHSSSNGIASNAIGSILIDPSDASGRTIYVGTGEQNGSSDSEAGVGLYKSTDYGNTWHLITGSVPAARNRAIGAIAIDPSNPDHIYIGTDVARHGASSVNGGRFTPPDAPMVGLYESTNGGASFSLVFSKESDTVNPGTPNGSDFFRGGVTTIAFDSTGVAPGLEPTLYFSMFDYGVFRRNSNTGFEQVFAASGGGLVQNSAGARTEFALAPMGNKLRIYVGDTDGTTTNLYRVDDATVPAATLTDGKTNPGWKLLSSPTAGTPGFASYNFCETQCSYDMWVASPAGHPDTVWIGGSMAYDEIFTLHPPSNGRAVQRSTDGGASFTDMTDDAQTTPMGMHPDQHAVAFAPGKPDIAFLGSDGGLVRTSGNFTDTSSSCASRGLTGADLTDCQNWLKAVPNLIYSLNDGLSTIQFQSITVNPQDPKHDIMGGSQDNGTWSFSAARTGNNWYETVGGDGGQSAIDAVNPNVRMHTYYGPNGDINFKGTDPTGWDVITDPLANSKEGASFYIPLVADPNVGGTLYAGLEHVWRTQDDGGAQAYLDQHCNEMTGDFAAPCGDWVALGGNLIDTTYGSDKAGSYIVSVNRAASDKSTLWAATRFGRLFISTNADAAAASVAFTRLDTAAQPQRFISGIAVDPKNPYHAFVTYSGYNAYTPSTTGHVFEVTYNPTTASATWKDISYDLGDAPITGVAYDDQTSNLYIASDFGVATLHQGSSNWVPAATGLPQVAVYSLTISSSGRVLYAATHGRGAWRLELS